MFQVTSRKREEGSDYEDTDGRLGKIPLVLKTERSIFMLCNHLTKFKEGEGGTGLDCLFLAYLPSDRHLGCVLSFINPSISRSFYSTNPCLKKAASM